MTKTIIRRKRTYTIPIRHIDEFALLEYYIKERGGIVTGLRSIERGLEVSYEM